MAFTLFSSACRQVAFDFGLTQDSTNNAKQWVGGHEDMWLIYFYWRTLVGGLRCTQVLLSLRQPRDSVLAFCPTLSPFGS